MTVELKELPFETDAGFGSRARIGLVVLENDQTVEAELASQGVSAEVSRVGCLGLCFAEPLLDVQLPGGHRIFYGNVSTGDVAEIVSSHLLGGMPITVKALGYIAE